jgi:lipopolysaccharide transport system ATP-binding protein
MADPAIQVEAVSKSYRLGCTWPGLHQPLKRVFRWVGRAGRRRSSTTATRDLLWALRDVNFSVERGEVLGVVGRNGAGKTTLLKVLSRITPPSQGRIMMRGRVASLLEVGTGFHPELTGRDNIYLNGSILGMTHAEIRKHFDQIVEFAGVERFLDTPVKRYSSGMYVRLAFAVAAHLEPEILLVDEVLAVGDVAFQRKCLGKMQTIAQGGRTVLFVSHNMAALNAFCTRAIRLDDGRLIDEGATETVVGRYIADSHVARRERSFRHDASRPMQIRRIELRGSPEGPAGLLYRTSDLGVRLEYEVAEPIPGAQLCLMLEKPDGTPICHTRNVDGAAPDCEPLQPGRHAAEVRFPGGLLNAGSYIIRAAIDRWAGCEPIDQPDGLAFELHDLDGGSVARTSGHRRPGVLYLELPWRCWNVSSDFTSPADALASRG